LSGGEKSAKIGIGGYQGAIFTLGPFKDDLIIFALQTIIANVGRIMSRLHQAFRDKEG